MTMNTYAGKTIAARNSRRRFLRGMGLSAVAAPLVLGIGDILVGRALGQATGRKMALFFVHGESWEGGDWEASYTPRGVARHSSRTGEGDDRIPDPGQEQDLAGIEMPPFFAPLGQWKDRAVVVDGLPMKGVILNNPGSIHGLGNTALNAVGKANAPDGTSIDQHVAQVLSGDTPIKSLLFGLGGRGEGDESTGTFVASRGAAVAHAHNANTLLSRMVGTPTGAPGVPAKPALGGKLMDLVREDLKRLDRGLAVEEKELLTEYLASMEAYQKKESDLAKLASGGGCMLPTTPPPGTGNVPGLVAMDSMFQLSTLALKCGVTNVIGASIGNTVFHNDLDMFVADYTAHGGYARAMESLAPISMSWVAKMLTDLGPLADSMTVTIVPGGGLAFKDRLIHHGCASSAALVIDGTGALHTGGRFLRLNRHLADLYATLAGALGAPVDRFNGVGTGAIKELQA